MESTTPPWRSCRINRVLHSFLRKVAQKMRGQASHLLSLLSWQSVKYSIYPTRSTLGEIFGVDFEKNQKNVKNVSKKNLYCIVVWLKKYFFSKTKDEIDYSKCYKTISMPFSWYYIFFELIQRDFGLHLPIIRIRIIKTKNSALKSDNALNLVHVLVYLL